MPIDCLAGLNARQQEAVRHHQGPLLVVAGAGSGKTRVITHRVASLIQEGVRPDRILAITFTNKAAGEMQERIEGLLGLKTPWITTFHSAGLRIMKLEQSRLGFEHPFTILDEDDQRRMLRRVVKEMELNPKDHDPRAVGSQISRWKNRLLTPDKVPAQDEYDTFLKIYYRYTELTQIECVVDFDDLLLRPVLMFEEDEELRQQYQERFPFVLIDEYQDTNEAQYRLVRLLGGHGNVCATGDPDQAIYGWRGADIHNILNFEKDFPGCTTVLLEQNYRSTQTILRAAQAVVEHNTQRKDKTIFSEKESGDPITLITVDDQDDEAMAVAAACQRLHDKDGRSYSDIAVFYRTNHQGRAIEEWLNRRGLPYRIVGATRFYDRAEVKDLLAYARLLINPRDQVSFERAVNTPRRGVGDRTLDIIRDMALDEECAIPDIFLDDSLLDRVAVGRASKPLRGLAHTWRRLHALDRADAARCLRAILDITGLEDYHLQDDPEKGQERLWNLGEVISAAEQFVATHADGGLAAYLDHVSLITAVDNRRGGEDEAVSLMTLHASKGLEYPVVFITACEQGVLPLVRHGATPDYEEERRLMYVGITRAQERLFLSRSVTRSQFGQTKRNPPSMFLAEIPDECIQHYDRSTIRSARGDIEDFREGPSYPIDSLARQLLDDAWSPEPMHERPAPPASSAPPQTAVDPETLRAQGLLTTGSALKAALRSKGSAQGLAASRSAKAAATADSAPIVLPGDPFQPGDMVVHQLYGPGHVRELQGPSNDRRIRIDFDDGTSREMFLHFVGDKLKRL
ncbi:MAG: ATP-dependent DNA helicase PcrA [Planctomycetota bacterium]|nr:MAG: ATP-dependent DNA helicase PcrA [Planctomycetota bacterium]